MRLVPFGVIDFSCPGDTGNPASIPGATDPSCCARIEREGARRELSPVPRLDDELPDGLGEAAPGSSNQVPSEPV
jgi:hypothetical protein